MWRLRLRGRASTLLSESCWFDSLVCRLHPPSCKNELLHVQFYHNCDFVSPICRITRRSLFTFHYESMTACQACVCGVQVCTAAGVRRGHKMAATMTSWLTICSLEKWLTVAAFTSVLILRLCSLNLQQAPPQKKKQARLLSHLVSRWRCERNWQQSTSWLFLSLMFIIIICLIVLRQN